MRKVYRHSVSFGTNTFLGEGTTQEEAWKIVLNEIARIYPDYKIPYTRYWEELDGSCFYDVGFHHVLFIIKEEGI